MEVHIMKKLVKVVSTRQTLDDIPVETELSIVFGDNITVEDVYEIAASAAVIKWQGNARKAKAIPRIAEYMVPKPGTRSTQDPIDFAIAKYGIDEVIAMLEAKKKANA
jgi:hypothetical protein